jgi:putative ABC transport system ATP-binding protein
METRTDDILIATGLDKSFGHGPAKVHVLRGLDLTVRRGEFLAVMGPSGCGKSTLMHILGLMLTPSSGKLYLDGCDTSGLNDAGRARLRREKIGFVFQRFNLLATISAYQNIAVAERLRGKPLDGQIQRALAAVDMTDKALRKPNQLSMGEQQRIAIARAITHQPEMVMADEPTGNLDSANAERILELFDAIHRRHNITMVMITHSPTAAQRAERIIYLTDGRIRTP